MSIGKKIALGFAATLLSFALIAWTVYRNTERLIDDSHWVVHTHAVLEVIDGGFSALKSAEFSVQRYVLSGDEVDVGAYRGAQGESGGSRRRIHAAERGQSQPSPARASAARTAAFVAFARWTSSSTAERRATPKPMSRSYTTSKDETSADELRATLHEMQAEEQRLLGARNKTSEDTASTSLSVIVWGSISHDTAVSGHRRVDHAHGDTTRSSAAARGATRSAPGNMAYRIAIGTRDELGRLATEFNRMTESLSTTTVSADTEKRARARIEGLLQTISETAANLVSSTAEILAGTTQQAAGAQEQAAAVAQTVTTVNQVVQTSEQAAERARAVADISHRSLDYSRTGRKVVEDSIVVMTTVKEQVESSAESILILAEQAQAIGDIITSVNEIAEQTNLLALNAAIEASRAGEHGKGFGVVAVEVKTLADQSKKATARIRQILSEIQKATSSAVMTTEECSKSVNTASRVISQAGDNIRSLADIIDQAAASGRADRGFRDPAGAGHRADPPGDEEHQPGHQSESQLDAPDGAGGARSQRARRSLERPPAERGARRRWIGISSYSACGRTFVAELQEHVHVFNRELLALEQQPNAEIAAESIRALFRTAHSLKGAARAVSATKLESVCHALEDLLAALRDGTRTLTPEILATLFAAVDTFEETGRQFATSSEAPSNAPEPTSHRAALAAVQVPPQFDAAVPAPAPAPAAAPPHSFPPPPAAREAANQNIASDALVRVPGRKLDGLLAQSGELLIARRRFDGRRSELAAAQDLVASVRAEWRTADTFLKQWKPATKSNGARHEPHEPHEANDVLSAAALPRKAASALQTTRERLEHLERALDGLFAGMTEDMRTLDRVASSLEEQIHKVRMLPFSHACDGLFRATRDLALEQDKAVELAIEGGDTELDRSIIDGLRDPLLHVVRNAIDHGIETAEQRRAAGKPARATIRVAVPLRAEQVAITIEDDGHGIDLRARARRRPSKREPRVARKPTSRRAARDLRAGLLDRRQRHPRLRSRRRARRGEDPGRSDARQRRAGDRTPGAARVFTLLVPLTVTTLRVLFVRVGSRDVRAAVVERAALGARRSDIGLIEGREMLLLDARTDPGRLARGGARFAQHRERRWSRPSCRSVITRQQNRTRRVGRRRAAERARRGAASRSASASVACATSRRRCRCPTGRVALLLRPADLVRMGMGRAPSAAPPRLRRRSAQTSQALALLVDDSVTTRTLERSILEAAGYEVLIAVDGEQRLAAACRRRAPIIVVSDVEMPSMDGFALTETIRSSKRFRDLPVVLLTSLDSAQDRARGMESWRQRLPGQERLRSNATYSKPSASCL